MRHAIILSIGLLMSPFGWANGAADNRKSAQEMIGKKYAEDIEISNRASQQLSIIEETVKSAQNVATLDAWHMLRLVKNRWPWNVLIWRLPSTRNTSQLFSIALWSAR